MNKALKTLLLCLFFGFASIAGGCSQEIDPGLPLKYEVGGSGKSTVSLRDDGKTTIKFYGASDNMGVISAMVSKYNETSKENYVRFYELKHDRSDVYDMFMLSQAEGFSSYDVILYDLSWNTDFASKNLILDLSQFIESSELDLSAYLPNAIQASQYEGRMFSMPLNVGISMLYYRRDIIERAPVTWDDLIDICNLAHEQRLIKNSIVFTGKMSDNGIYYFMEMLNSYGVKILDDDGRLVADRPRLAAVLEKFKDIYSSTFVPSTIHFMSESGAYNTFAKGESLLMWGLPDAWLGVNSKDSDVFGKFAAAPIPSGSAGLSTGNILTGSSLAIHKGSENVEASWDFIDFMVNYTAQRMMAISGGLSPSLTEIYDNSDAKAANAHFSSSGYRNSLFQASVPSQTTYYFDCLSVLREQILEYVSDSVDLEEALDEIEAGLQKAVGF